MTQQDLGRSESGEQGCWKEAREVYTTYGTETYEQTR